MQSLLNGPEIISVFSTRRDGNMSLSYGETAHSLINRKGFLNALGIDYQDLICCQQVHGNNTAYVKEEDKGRGALSYDNAMRDTDALITDKRNLPLSLLTADCLPVFFYDPKMPAIGLAHAGWRGTKAAISARTLKLMQGQFGSRPQDIKIGFGPDIRGCCYEVGGEFKDIFPGSLIERNERYYLDLIGLNKQGLLALGIKEQNIFDCGICTSCRNKEFFSFRREGSACARLISVMMLK